MHNHFDVCLHLIMQKIFWHWLTNRSKCTDKCSIVNNWSILGASSFHCHVLTSLNPLQGNSKSHQKSYKDWSKEKLFSSIGTKVQKYHNPSRIGNSKETYKQFNAVMKLEELHSDRMPMLLIELLASRCAFWFRCLCNAMRTPWHYDRKPVLSVKHSIYCE